MGDGTVTLKNVTVKGTTYIYGGGANSIHLDDSTIGQAVVQKDGVRIVASGSTTVSQVTAQSSLTLEASNLTGTGFGSIVVNEVTFDTAEAILYISGQEEGVGDEAIRENLGVGQVVLVEGTGDGETSSGIAKSVIYSPNVIGPVTAVYDVTPKIKIFRILGQTVMANADTIFSSGSMESIREDNLLEVSGLVDDEGRIRATYIKRIANSFDPGREIEVKGLIQNLNLANKTFTINDLQISYSQAQLVNFTEGEMSPGQQIHVRGRVSENYVSASMIRLTEENRITNVERANVEAFITD
ncbi:MAG: DUF5666 domain-containing protein, partial [Candidatus Bathyarchaeota archaeon]|nr:DUF5666 domain-containing protein [Candidatus Bathyarchaeota archaeon]